MQSNKLFVANISFEATEEMIRALFEEVGTVEDLYYARDRESGRPRGFAFITMATGEEAEAAIAKLNGYVVNERDLRVSIAIPKEDRPRPPRGDGGAYGGGGYGGGHGPRAPRGDGGAYGGGGYGGERGPRAPRLNPPREGGGYRGGGGGYRGGGRGGYRDDRGGGGGGGYRDDRPRRDFRDDRRPRGGSHGDRDGGFRSEGDRPPRTLHSDDK